jgi:hypothetical protein
VIVGRLDGSFDLYGPAPQAVFGSTPEDRLFCRVMAAEAEPRVQARMAEELRFDPDLWLIEIEDRQGRPFVDLTRERD